MRQIQVADLTASANEIDSRMGPIPGRSSDRIAGELRWAADELQRALDMLGDIPGQSLTERLQNYIGCYMALQLKAAEAPAHSTNEPQPPSKMLTMLAILNAAGGQTEASDSEWCWLNWFCEDAEPTDTFNQAVDAKLVRVTHDSRFDSSTVYLTEAGRAATAALSRPESKR